MEQPDPLQTVVLCNLAAKMDCTDRFFDYESLSMRYCIVSEKITNYTSLPTGNFLFTPRDKKLIIDTNKKMVAAELYILKKFDFKLNIIRIDARIREILAQRVNALFILDEALYMLNTLLLRSDAYLKYRINDVASVIVSIALKKFRNTFIRLNKNNTFAVDDDEEDKEFYTSPRKKKNRDKTIRFVQDDTDSEHAPTILLKKRKRVQECNLEHFDRIANMNVHVKKRKK